MPLRLKRVYDAPAPADGTRVLVDRLWPRGLSKASAHIDLWLKDVAPSDALRKWFAHDPAKWAPFVRRYAAELKSHPDELRQLRSLARRGTVTLLYAAKDDAHNNAVALRSHLSRRAKPRPRSGRSDA